MRSDSCDTQNRMRTHSLARSREALNEGGGARDLGSAEIHSNARVYFLFFMIASHSLANPNHQKIRIFDCLETTGPNLDVSEPWLQIEYFFVLFCVNTDTSKSDTISPVAWTR